MALSAEQKRILEIALADREVAQAIAAAIDSGSNPQAAAVADIADTSTATAEDVGDKVNALLASLRAAGILAD